MSLKKIDVLRELTFGNQVAEEEKDTLGDYFVQTNPWKKIYQGDVDIVYGPKGSGKSAIYVLIQEHEKELVRKRIILVPAENLRGDPAFSALLTQPPTGEREFGAASMEREVIACSRESLAERDDRDDDAPDQSRAAD